MMRRIIRVNTKQFLAGAWRGGHWGALNTASPQKIVPNPASPQEKSMEHRHRNIVLVWWYKGPHVIILFKIIRFYSKKSPKQAHYKAKTVVTLLMSLDRFRLNFSTGKSMKMTAKLGWKVTAAWRRYKNVSGKSFVQKLWKREYRR